MNHLVLVVFSENLGTKSDRENYVNEIDLNFVVKNGSFFIVISTTLARTSF